MQFRAGGEEPPEVQHVVGDKAPQHATTQQVL
jgi:hypothetical protein